MEIILGKECYALGIWKNPLYGRIEHIRDDSVDFREIPLIQMGFKKGGGLYSVKKENLMMDEPQVKTTIIKQINCQTIKCDRCGENFPNHPHFIGKFHPSQVKNLDNRLGYYFICKSCIAGK